MYCRWKGEDSQRHLSPEQRERETSRLHRASRLNRVTRKGVWEEEKEERGKKDQGNQESKKGLWQKRQGYVGMRMGEGKPKS